MTEAPALERFRRLQILDGTALKLIAVVSMVLDHIGDCFFPGATWLRAVGRIAMPVFAFCVSEGFLRTRDRKSYLLRMLLFGLISEVPFDLFASGKLFDLSHQNIMLTFSWALAGLICFERIMTKERSPIRDISAAFVLLGFLAGSLLLRLDYNMTATALIFVFWLLKDKADWVGNTAAAAVHAAFRNRGVNWFGLLGFIPVFMYNGKRGRGLKWFFYVFYPAHMLLLFMIKRYI